MAHYENGETYFMHANNVGTTAFVTDYRGAVIQDETHYPWGQEWTTMGTMEEERFASLQHRDSETTLDPTHFRMYNSGQGRWQTPDPVGSCPFHPENFDRYSYGGNNPTDNVDPRGDFFYLENASLFDDYEFGFIPGDPAWFCGACLATCHAIYTGVVLGCFAGATASGALSNPVLAAFRFRQCVANAGRFYAGCVFDCSERACNPDNPLPVIF